MYTNVQFGDMMIYGWVIPEFFGLMSERFTVPLLPTSPIPVPLEIMYPALQHPPSKTHPLVREKTTVGQKLNELKDG